MECVSSVLQMLRWNPPRAGGWIPAKANGLSVALLLLCSDVTAGPPSRDNSCFGEEGEGLVPRSHRRLGNAKSVLTRSSLCCSYYLLFNMGLKRTSVQWHVSLLGVSPIFGLDEATDVVQCWREREKKNGTTLEEKWSCQRGRTTTLNSHFSDMCAYCGQHAGPAATWPHGILFLWHGSFPRSLPFASASSSAASHSSKTCQRGELLTRSVGVALSMVCWPVQDVPRLRPGCHLGWAPASHDPLERCTNCACQYSQAEAETSSISSSSVCFSYYYWAVNNAVHKKKKLYDSFYSG